MLPTFEKSANYYNCSLRGDLISNISYEARLLGLPALKPEKSLDTKTFNIDFRANFRGISVDEGDMNVSLSSNYTISNKREGNIKNPAIVTSSRQTVSNATQGVLFSHDRYHFSVNVPF